jgi:hypothetical protein
MRTRAARLYQQVQRGLLDHCPDPSFEQLATIDRLCRLTVRLAELRPTDPDYDNRFLALDAALQRSYKALGAGAPRPRRQQTLAEVLSS